MPGEQLTKSDKTFLSIIQGDLREKVDQDTNGAVRRDWEKDGQKGTKYELIYKSWKGFITNLMFKDTDFGEQLQITFHDAILSIPVNSRYFSDFAKRICGADLQKEITVSPFDFEPEDGKRLMGISVYQEGKKLENYFWNSKDGKSCNGMPVPSGDVKTYKKRDWTEYYLQVEKFLIENIEKLETKTMVVEDDIPVVKNEESEVKIKDIPF